MCGIVGMAGLLTAKHEKAFETLLILDSLRGKDSTGVAAVKRNGDTVVAKTVGNPFELMDSHSYGKVMAGFQKVLIGHNRYATIGAVTKKNAHPFEIGDLIGVHNGTIGNKHVLDQGYKFDVDSQALYNHIDKFGLQEAIDKISGAWALVWWNTKENSLNFLRNKERPLFISYEEGGSACFWASEKWMLTVALSRGDIKFTDPFPLDEDTHTSVTIDEAGKFGDWIEQEVKSSFVPFVVQTHGTTTSRPSGWNNGPGQQAQTTLGQQTNTKNGSANTHVSLTVVKGGYAGKKQQRLRCVSLASDENSAQYIECVDANQGTVCPIRLYINRNDSDKAMVGKEIFADISETAYNAPRGLFYKAVYSTVRLAEVKGTPKQVKEEAKAAPTFRNSRGEMVSRSDWLDQHGECAMCGGFVNPDHEIHKFDNHHNVVCGVCIEDPMVRGLLPQLH